MKQEQAKPDCPIEKLQRLLEKEGEMASDAIKSGDSRAAANPLERLEALLSSQAAQRPLSEGSDSAKPEDQRLDPLERLEALFSSATPTLRQADTYGKTSGNDPLNELQTLFEKAERSAGTARAALADPLALLEEQDRKAPEALRGEDPPAEDAADLSAAPEPAPPPHEPLQDAVDAAKLAFRQSRRELGERATLDQIIRHACKKIGPEGQTVLLQIQLKAMLKGA